MFKVNSMKRINSYSFLVIGKTQESKDTQEGFKRYIGVGSTYVLAVNPDKKELDELMGFESKEEPQYVVDGENGKEARVTFIVRTDPEQCNGIDITNRITFTLRNVPAYNRDKTKVQVIDGFGNSTWADVDDAKAGKKLVTAEGKELRIDDKYRMACQGEADLVSFLKTYLCVQDVFNYVNGAWVKKDHAEDYQFGLEHIKDYFSGDFTEVKEAIKLQPHNKVKLLYGVRTTEDNKQYQAICTREGMVLRNSAGSKALLKLEKDILAAKAAGSFPTTEYRVQELAEYTVEPTNLENTPVAEDTASEMPWD